MANDIEAVRAAFLAWIRDDGYLVPSAVTDIEWDDEGLPVYYTRNDGERHYLDGEWHAWQAAMSRAALAVAPATAQPGACVAPAPDNAPRVIVEPDGASCWRVWLHINAGAWAVGDFRHDKEAAERFAEPLRRALLAAIPGGGDVVKEAMTELGFAPAPATGDAAAVRDVPESFDPATHPLRDEAERWWCAGYLRQGVVVKSKRGPAPFTLFMQGFVAGRETMLPLSATATAVEDARRDVVDKAKAWLARPVAGRGAYKGTAALEESIEALLAAESEAAATHAAKESRSDDRPASGQGGV